MENKNNGIENILWIFVIILIIALVWQSIRLEKEQTLNRTVATSTLDSMFNALTTKSNNVELKIDSINLKDKNIINRITNNTYINEKENQNIANNTFVITDSLFTRELTELHKRFDSLYNIK